MGNPLKASKTEAEVLPRQKRVVTLGPEETEAVGHDLAAALGPGSVAALFGELGSGKTTFVRGVCRGLEVEDEVTSPTFTLIHEYRGRLPVYHVDLYRIERPDEALQLGIEEYFDGPGVCLIEWADRIAAWLPDGCLEVHLKAPLERAQETRREICLKRR